MSVRIFTKDQARVFGETELGPQRAFHEELVIDITQVGPALDVATLAVPVRSVVAEAEQVRIDATPPRRSDSITLVCLANDLQGITKNRGVWGVP